jgi:hypothetical protein
MPQLTILYILLGNIVGLFFNVTRLSSYTHNLIICELLQYRLQTCYNKQFEPCIQDQEWQLDKPEINLSSWTKYASRNVQFWQARSSSIGFLYCIYKLSFVVIVKTKDKIIPLGRLTVGCAHNLSKWLSAYSNDLLPIIHDHENYKTNNSGQHI